MKKFIICLSIIFFSGCAELNEVVKQLPDGTFNNLPNIGSVSQLSNNQIAAGLREALDQGIDRQVTKLTQKDGFFRNELVKILLPEELKRVDSGLRSIGLSSLADRGLEVLNRAAEDAVSESTPIFIDAVKGITFSDAKNILLGNDDAPDLTDYVSQQALSGVFKMISVEESNIRNNFNFRSTDLLKQVFALQD